VEAAGREVREKVARLLFFVGIGSSGRSSYRCVAFDGYFAVQIQVAIYYVCFVTQVQLTGVLAKRNRFWSQFVVGATLVAAGRGLASLRMCHESGNVESKV
jgi:hypothetical protein